MAGVHWRVPWILGPALALAVAVRVGGMVDALPLYRLHIEPGPFQELMAFRERILDLAFLPPGQRLW